MAPIPCPSCGADLPFRTSFSVYAVCEYCGSAVLRQDRDVSLIGAAADLPDEMTPLQIGTGLRWRGTDYLLVGRLRVAWSDGAWNEWFMAGGSDSAWLAEAQGFLMVSVPLPPAQAPGITAATLPRLDDTLTLDGRAFRVTDIKQAVCLGSEGELPFAAPKGRMATYYDLLDADGGFASIESGPDGIAIYAGDYVAFDDLALTDLRAIEGWSPPRAAIAAGDPFLPPPT